MALPSGVVPTDEVFADASTSSRNLWFVFRVFECPAEMEDDGLTGHFPKQAIQASVEITCPTSADLYADWYTSDKYTPEQEDTWSSDISSPTYQGSSYTDNYCTDIINKSYQAFGKTQYLAVRCKYSHENVASADGKIYAVIFESVFGDHWSGSSTTTGNTMEYTERTGNDRLYLPDRTCSAWHMKDLVCKAWNRILEENRTYCSIPVIDQVAP